MKNVFFILTFFFLCSFAADEFTNVKTIPVEATFMTTDNIGNCYVVGANNQVTKYNNQGVPEANFSNKNFGNLKLVDATNPLKVLLFYADFNQVVALDNKLSVRSETALRDINILQPLLICTSMNEGMWIFDQQDFQLKRLDLNLQVVQESGNIIQITGQKIEPIQLLEANNYVYLNNPLTGILIFDLFGSYYKTIPVKGINCMQVSGDELMYYKDLKLVKYNLKTFEESALALPSSADSLTLSVRVEQLKMYLLKKQQLNIYTLL